MAGDVGLGSLTVTLGANTAGLMRAQQAMLQLQKQVLNSVNQINAGLNSVGGNMQKVGQQATTAGNQVVAANNKTTQSTTQAGNAAQVSNKKVVASVNEATSSYDKFNKTLTNVGQSLRSFGWLATTTLTVPIVAAGKTMIDASSTFEYSMQKIVGLAGVGQGEVNKWSNEVKDMAVGLGKKPQELADALYFVASAGFKTSEALEIVKQSAKASAAGMGEVKTITDLTTSVMNAYGQGNITAVRTLDILTAAVREGKGEADGMARSLGSVIPFAAQLGVSFDQVAGATAAMTLTGASAANAATYLRNIFMKLIHPARQTETALREMGTSSGELRNMLKKPGGLMEALVKVRELTNQYGEEMMGKVFPNIRAMLAELMLTGKNYEYNKFVMDAVTNSAGSLAKAYDAIYNTTKQRLGRAQAELNRTLIEFGNQIKDQVIPFLERWVDRLKDLAGWYSNLDGTMKKVITSSAGVLAALGPLSLVIATLSWGVKGTITIFKDLFGWITKIAGFEGFGFMRTLVKLGGPIAAAVVVFKKLYDVTVGYKNKVVEAAKANSDLEKTLINVNGEIKKLKDVTTSDFASMDPIQLQKYAGWAQNAAKKQQEVVRNIYGKAKMKEGDYEYMMKVRANWEAYPQEDKKKADDLRKEYNMRVAIFDLAQKRLAPGSMASFQEKNQAEKWLKDVGKYGDVMDIETTKLNDYKKVAENTYAALDGIYTEHSANVAKNAEENAKVEGEFSASDTMKSMRDKIKLIDNTAEAYQRLGLYGYDANKEKLKVYNDTLEEFFKNNVFAGSNINEIGSSLRMVQQYLSDAEKSTKAFEGTIASIDFQKLLLGDEFDANGAKLDAYQKQLEKFVDILMTPDPATGKFRVVTDEDLATIQMYQDRIKEFKRIQEEMIDRQTIEMLTAEAEAFGSMDGKIQVLNTQLQAYERNLRNMLKARASGEWVPEDKIKEAIDNIQNFKASILDLQNLQELQFLQNMNNSLTTAGNSMALLSGYANVLQNDLKFLSETGQATSEKFDELTSRLLFVDTAQEAIERTSNAFSDMFDAIWEGEDVAKKIKQIWKDALGSVIKDLSTFIIKTALAQVALRALKMDNIKVAEAFKENTGSGIEELMKKLTGEGISGKFLKNPLELIKPESMMGGMDPKSLKGVASGIEEVTSAKSKAGVVSKLITEATIAETAATKAATLTEAAAIPVAKATTAADMASIPVTEAKASADIGAAGASAMKGAAKLPFPLGILAIGLAIGAVMAGVASIIKAKKMKEGGVVPEGYPNDTFPAMLSTGEVVIPEKKLNAFLGGAQTADKLTSSLPKVTKLATGGVVPPGYPNDTFPAMLSSNEAVIPLDRIKKQQSPFGERGAEVKFVIEQDKLVGILKKASKKGTIY